MSSCGPLPGVSPRPARRTAALWLVLGATVLIGGCGGRGDRPVTVPVTGTVTYQGEPVKFGTINFVPTQGGRPASVPLKDGNFVGRIHENAEGLVPGTYKVFLMAYKAPVPEIPPAELIGDKAEKWLAVPKKYTTAETTDLTLTVPEKGGSQTVKFDLED